MGDAERSRLALGLRLVFQGVLYRPTAAGQQGTPRPYPPCWLTKSGLLIP
jgi:hypothetical protein